MKPVWNLLGALLAVVVITAIAAAIACRPSFDPQGVFAVTGLLLQLAGLGTVAYGLGRTRREFGIEGDFEVIWKRVKKLLGFKPPPVVLQPDSARHRVTSDFTALWDILASDQPLEERVAALEQQAARLRDALRDVDWRLTAQAAEQRSALDEERRQREQQDQQLQNALKETATGGLHIETAGLVWLMFGIIYATVPGPLSEGLKALCGGS